MNGLGYSYYICGQGPRRANVLAPFIAYVPTLGVFMSDCPSRLLGYENLEVINPDGGQEDAEEQARRGKWKKEERDSYWKMTQEYIGSDVTSMVTLPVIIFEQMTMLQKMAVLMKYCHLLDLADECEDIQGKLNAWSILGGLSERCLMLD